jgi:predicted GIY-YIG superfamily endonuclease
MYYIYIAYNKENKLCNISITNNLSRRIKLLRLNHNNFCKIVFYEEYETSELATEREDILSSLPEELIDELVKENNPLLIELK